MRLSQNFRSGECFYVIFFQLVNWVFDIIFQLLHGAPKEVLSELYLDKKPEDYHFINQGGVFEVSW